VGRQALSQAPQLAALLTVSMHVPADAQYCWPVVAHEHFPLRQDSPLWHALPQVPQLAVSVDRFTHELAESQNVCPEGQVQ
jgi:hypothetical protein